MSLQSVIVGFENTNPQALRNALARLYGRDMHGEVLLGMHFVVDDMKEAYQFGANYIREHDIEEADAVLRQEDILPFSTELDISAARGRQLGELQVHIADLLARVLSGDLGVRALVRIDDGNVLFRMYDRGHLVRDFVEEYRASMASAAWMPRQVVS